MLQVMSIGGNCSDLSVLGESRIPGPVDNWSSWNGFADTPCLFENFKEVIEKGPIEIQDRKPAFKGDSDKLYRYEHYQSVHINMDDPNIVQKVLNRHDQLLKFLEMVKNEKDCFFSYSLNEYDVELVKGKWKVKNHFIPTVKRLSEYFPIKKLIFIGTPRLNKKNAGFSAHADEFPEELNYIDVPDVDFCMTRMTEEQRRKCFERFRDCVNKLSKKKHFFISLEPRCKSEPKKRHVFQDDWDD